MSDYDDDALSRACKRGYMNKGIVSKPATDKFRKGFERTFRKKKNKK